MELIFRMLSLPPSCAHAVMMFFVQLYSYITRVTRAARSREPIPHGIAAARTDKFCGGFRIVFVRVCDDMCVVSVAVVFLRFIGISSRVEFPGRCHRISCPKLIINPNEHQHMVPNYMISYHNIVVTMFAHPIESELKTIFSSEPFTIFLCHFGIRMPAYKPPTASTTMYHSSQIGRTMQAHMHMQTPNASQPTSTTREREKNASKTFGPNAHPD